jgi:uncharacterized Zn-binding protein involved in type VI secretion
MKTGWKFLWFFGALILLLPSVANAQCDTVGNTLADGRIIGPFTIDNTADQQIYINVTAGHSYSFEILAPNAGEVPEVNIGENSCPITNPAGTTDTTDFDPVLTLSGGRLSWTATADSTTFVVSVATTSSSTYTVSVSDTTLYNPRWSTFGGYTTQWGLHNTTNTTISGNLVVTTTAGAVVSNTTFDIPPGRVVFKTSNGLGIAVSQSGNATFTHNGPPGAIQGDAYMVSSDVKTVVPTKFEAVRQSAH